MDKEQTGRQAAEGDKTTGYRTMLQAGGKWGWSSGRQRCRWLQPNLRMMQLGPAISIVQFILFCFCRSSGLIVSNRFPSNTFWFHTPGRSILKLKAKRSQYCRRNPCPGPNSVQQLLYFILIFLQNLTEQRLCK